MYVQLLLSTIDNLLAVMGSPMLMDPVTNQHALVIYLGKKVICLC